MQPFEREVRDVIVDALMLGDAMPDSFDPNANLFDALGLDSVDALEIVLAIKRTFGVVFEESGDQNREVFASLRSLSAFVEQRRNAATAS